MSDQRCSVPSMSEIWYFFIVILPGATLGWNVASFTDPDKRRRWTFPLIALSAIAIGALAVLSA